MRHITIGSDPEYGVIENGIPKSVVGFLRGTKKRPHKLNEYVSCQVDNVGAECCIPPCDNEDDFVNYMLMAKRMTQEEVQKKAPGFELVSVSSQRYNDVELNSPTAQMFGCEPSWCVYTDDISPRPSPQQVGNLRSFGFHIHIGFPVEEGENQFKLAANIIKAMDVYLGLPSIIIDTDGDRRRIYGNAGDFRFRRIKDIAIVEYRTLGGAMHGSEELLRFVYQQTMKAVTDAFENPEKYESTVGYMVQHIIDTGNAEAAAEMIKEFNIEIPETIIQSQLQYA